MPKLPVLRDREVIRAHGQLGFTAHRERATSHLMVSHPDGRRTVVARHPGKDIPRGTLRSIVRDLDVSVAEFLKTLRK